MKNPKSIILDIPYFSQRNNQYNPDGSCSTTCIAMVLKYYDVQRRWGGHTQFEDEIYQYFLDNRLTIGSPNDMVKCIENYGVTDNYNSYGTIESVKEHLAKGNPVITHGYFTNVGHLVTLIGYNEKGFFVNDPYGEWFSSGYKRNNPYAEDTLGKELHYSYKLIRDTCIINGTFWVHLIEQNNE